MDIREKLLKLLIEAEEADKVPETSLKKINSSKFFNQNSASFYLLCEDALVNTGCLDKISICLHANFNPDTVKSFLDGINEFISFYVDIVNSYNNKQLIGKVKTSIENLQRAASEGDISIKTVNGIIIFFTNRGSDGRRLADREPLVEKDYALLFNQIKNLCVATNIINWERLLVYGKPKNSIFNTKKLSGDDYDETFPSNLSNEILKDFYIPGNEFSKFLSSFPWGDWKEPVKSVEEAKKPKPLHIQPGDVEWTPEQQAQYEKEVANFDKQQNILAHQKKLVAKKEEARKKMAAYNEKEYSNTVGDISGAGDSGNKTSDNEQFVYNVLVRYLTNIITKDSIDVETVFKEASAKAVNLALNTSLFVSDSHESIQGKEEETEGSELDSGEDIDVDSPELELPSGRGSLSYDLSDEGASANSSIPDIVNFNTYIDKLKKENNWGLKDTLTFLSTSLNTKDGADGLSAVLIQTFSTIGDTIFDVSFSAPVIKNNSADTFNVLTYLKSRALQDSKFLSSLADLLVSISDVNVQTDTKITEQSIIKKILSDLTEAKRVGGYGLVPAEVEELIEDLPKTREEALKAYTISHGSSGYAVDISNSSAKKINSIYNKLKKSFPIFESLSPSELSIIPERELTAGSELQKSLGLNIVPERAVISSMVSPQEASTGVKAVRLASNGAGSLSSLFDIYLKTITDILHPSINLPSWGLYQVIPGTTRKADFAVAKKLAAFPTTALPIGSKVDGRLVQFLFRSEADFNQVRDAIITAVRARKERFLSAINLTQIIELLSEISRSFNGVEELKLFSSPATVSGTEDAKNCRLLNLLDPKFAITDKLIKTDKTKAFVKGGSNPFVDLVSNILVLNSKNTNEAIINNPAVFEEAVEQKQESYELPTCYVAINIQIRAKLLLALVKLTDILEALLIVLRKIVIKLHGVLIAKLAGDNYGEIRSLFKYISRVLVAASQTDGSEEAIDNIIDEMVNPVNNRFNQSQKITSEFAAATSAQTNLDDTTYG